MTSSATLPILHFNDVYRVSPQKIAAGKTIDVTQFAALVEELREQWPKHPGTGTPEGLLLFSGDVFSPSVESSVTRGSHMVPVLNHLGIDASVAGNHDFDFGWPHFSTLLKDTHFPWLLSNIVDTNTSKTPEGLKELYVLERAGLRIGFIGLVEEEWIATVPSWPSNFVYKSMKDTTLALSQRLRDPSLEYKCDLVIALTHSRLPNDVGLAREVFALSPQGQVAYPIENEHGADILLGGHDHQYYAGPGVTSWDGYDVSEPMLGAEEDRGEVLVVKSGSDFRDLSSMELVLEATPEGSIRKRVIKEIRGRRHTIQPDQKVSPGMKTVVDKVLSSVGSTLKAPVCRTTVMIDVRSRNIRVAESAVTNWFADIVRHAYDDVLCVKGGGGSDAVLLCAGTFRGDSTYGPGVVTLGDIMEILPFEDPLVVLEVDGETIWDALESSLSTWPAQEGRFPAVSGMRVSWDSRKEPGNRVLGIWLLKSKGGRSESSEVEEEPIERTKEGRTYRLVTRGYMAGGHDGFTALLRGKPLIDDEAGLLMSGIVRKYLLGTHFVNRLMRCKTDPDSGFLEVTEKTREAIAAQERENAALKEVRSAVANWKHAIRSVIRRMNSVLHYQNTLSVAGTEHMSPVDVFDGSTVRKGGECAAVGEEGDEDLLVVTPGVDGRLKDEGRP